MRLAAALLAAFLLCALSRGAAAGTLEYRLDDEYATKGRGRDALENPVGIALWGRDILCVADKAKDWVARFEQSGKWLENVEKADGERTAELKAPTSVAFDKRGRLWVCDGGNDRILVYGPEGKLQRVLGRRGYRKGDLLGPTDIAIGGDGRVYVADTGNKRIQVFRQDGVLLDVWEHEMGQNRSWIDRPAVLAYYPGVEDVLLVADEGGSKLFKVDLRGRLDEVFDLTALVQSEVRVRDLAVDPTMDRIFVCDAAGNRILAIGWKGDLLTEVPMPAGAAASAVGVNWSLDLFVGDSAKRRILVYVRK